MTDRVISIYETLADVPSDFVGLARVGGDTTTYSILINATKVNGVITRNSIGKGPAADKPSAVLFGSGTWQDGSRIYTVNGTNYTDITSSSTNLQLLKWRAAEAKQQNGVSNAKILFIGDSTDAGSGAVTGGAGNRQLAPSDMLARSLIRAGISANVASQLGGAGQADVATLLTYNPAITAIGAGWGLNAVNSMIQRFGNATTATSIDFTPLDAAGDPLVFDTIEFYYLQVGTYAHYTVGVDGGAATWTSTPSGGAPLLAKQVITVPSGTHTVNFGKAAGDEAKVATILGWVCYDSTKKQVLCLNGGCVGKAIGTMGSSPGYSTATAEVDLIQPNLTFINSIINDSGVLTNLVTYKNTMQTLITKCLEYGSVILRPGNPVQPRDMQAYLDVNYQLATENNIPIIDIQAMTGTWDTYNTLGMMYDLLHPNKNGYRDIGNIMAKFITP